MPSKDVVLFNCWMVPHERGALSSRFFLSFSTVALCSQSRIRSTWRSVLFFSLILSAVTLIPGYCIADDIQSCPSYEITVRSTKWMTRTLTDDDDGVCRKQPLKITNKRLSMWILGERWMVTITIVDVYSIDMLTSNWFMKASASFSDLCVIKKTAINKLLTSHFFKYTVVWSLKLEVCFPVTSFCSTFDSWETERRRADRHSHSIRHFNLNRVRTCDVRVYVGYVRHFGRTILNISLYCTVQYEKSWKLKANVSQVHKT